MIVHFVGTTKPTTRKDVGGFVRETTLMSIVYLFQEMRNIAILHGFSLPISFLRFSLYNQPDHYIKDFHIKILGLQKIYSYYSSARSVTFIPFGRLLKIL